MVHVLVKRADLNIENAEVGKSLLCAILQGVDVETMSQLITDENINSKNAFGYTPLHKVGTGQKWNPVHS